ncbi:hypothetical protein ACH5RR_014729 [Cinchona calisaya]|uniref:DUF506 family protein n=1 Tax=Cinchona calisaya TaxID=153742 RepID=A0ABD2ZUN1_9GENT
MARIPVRFKRVAAAFDEEARARLYESISSSGSDHSVAAAETLTDLSDLVNSFLENEEDFVDHQENDDDDDDDDDVAEDKLLAESSSSERQNSSDSGIKDTLKRLFDCQKSDDYKVTTNIHTAVEKAFKEVDNNGRSLSSIDFKRRLMARLRDRGFDAGLCKSKWEKNGNCPSGDYEYIDVYMAGTRYFVEVSLAKEFIIARPTGRYADLLNIFPQIFVGKQEELKKVTRLMCSAIKKSMKKMGISVPPWRRLRYMQAKWFSSYKRIINEFAAPAVQKGFEDNSDDQEEEELMRRRKTRSVGFVPVNVPAISFLCREDFSTKIGGLRIGNLAAALNDNNSILS